MDKKPIFGVIGGSGLYDFPALTHVEKQNPDTPYGKPSAPIMIGTLAGKRVAFLARHGIGHTIPPGEVNYRANIFALKLLGVEKIISISACGSLREDFSPGHIVIPDQLFDFTNQRKRTFFESGLVAHVGVADPFCPKLSTMLYQISTSTGATAHLGGSLITIEGPRFSTKAESNTFQSWGMSIVGMTTSPEAFLAREAEMCYAVMAHVTDYDVWHLSEASVSVDMVLKTLRKNTEIAQKSIFALVSQVSEQDICLCQEALKNAIITNPSDISSESKKKLNPLVNKYLS
ncbi:MAG: S-methyl-5'-thioadenosine phosphorylase [Chloroflexi bacterium]|nr:S-methyl-5'-thioadenosine phosphorylase [Chloroflexota bacterium]